jgi:hypothetical protein
VTEEEVGDLIATIIVIGAMVFALYLKEVI